MSDEQDDEMSGRTSDPRREVLRQGLARNVVEPAGLPPRLPAGGARGARGRCRRPPVCWEGRAAQRDSC